MVKNNQNSTKNSTYNIGNKKQKTNKKLNHVQTTMAQ